MRHLGWITLLLFLSLPPATRGDDGEDQLTLLNRAVKLFNDRQWPEAVKAWEQVAAKNPELGRAWLNLGNAAHQAKEYRKAIPAFQKALELGQGYRFNAAYNIACCHALLGEKEPALVWLQKALDLGFRNLAHIREDADLKSLHDDERFKKIAAIVDISKLSRDEGWRYDLDLLAREIKRCHYSPYRTVSRDQFDAAVRKLREDIPKLHDNQVAAGLQKILRLVGDGHTSLSLGHPPAGSQAPVTFYLFSEGLFITEVDPRFKDLAGAEVLRVNGHAIPAVLQTLDTYIAQDNSMGLKWMAPHFLRMPKVLHGLGLLADDQGLPLTVRDSTGKERDVTLPLGAGMPAKDWASARPTGNDPLYLKNRRKAYWFEYLRAEKTVYFQFNSVSNQGDEPLEQFCGKLFAFIQNNEVEKLVIDMRWNGGGNNFLNRPLVHGLIRCDKVNQTGKLFVIIGRNTFSAAMCGAAEIERHTKALFVGEPTGSSPNFVGESAVIVQMPYSKLRASISDLYWENSVAMDYRTWIAPSIAVPPSFAAYRTNHDPALDAILGTRKPELPKTASPTGR